MFTVPIAHAGAFPYGPVILGGLVLVLLTIRILSWIRQGRRTRAVVTIACVVAVVTVVAVLHTFIVSRGRQDPDREQEAMLNRLGFPLELPSVPGYFPMGGFALPGGSLDIGLGRGSKPDLQDGQSSVLTVSFYRPSGSEGASDLSPCVTPDPRSRPQFTCRAKGPDLWMVTSPGMPYHEAIARKPNMIIVARGDAGARVPDSALIKAVTLLRPATAAQIAGLARAAIG